MEAPMIFLGAVAIALLAIAYLQGGDTPLRGLQTALTMMWRFAPMLALSFLVAGLMQTLVTPAMVSQWLGEQAGFRALLVAVVAGFLTQGGPFVTFPIAAVLYRTGASIGSVVAYITAWGVFGGAVPIWEFAIMGPRFLVIRLASSITLPIVAALLAQHLFSKVLAERAGLP